MTIHLEVEQLQAHIPVLFTHWLQRVDGNLNAPAEEHLQGVAMFVDICGFSHLAEQVTERHPTGVEELPLIINKLLSELISHVVYHGGDVVKFAGDALLVLWPMNPNNPSEAVRRTIQCGLTLGQSVAMNPQIGGFEPQIHIGIGAGEIRAMYVGNIEGRSELLLSGKPIIDMSSAMAQASAGQIILSKDAWHYVEEYFTASTLADCLLVESAKSDLLPPRALRPAPIPDNAAQGMRSLVPDVLEKRLSANESHWLAEIRKVTVLFINFSDIDYQAENATARVHEVTCEIQRIFLHYEGLVNRLIMDDKGTYIIGVFGLPPHVHEDDETRAIICALETHSTLSQLGVPCAIGIGLEEHFVAQPEMIIDANMPWWELR